MNTIVSAVEEVQKYQSPHPYGSFAIARLSYLIFAHFEFADLFTVFVMFIAPISLA